MAGLRSGSRICRTRWSSEQEPSVIASAPDADTVRRAASATPVAASVASGSARSLPRSAGQAPSVIPSAPDAVRHAGSASPVALSLASGSACSLPRSAGQGPDSCARSYADENYDKESSKLSIDRERRPLPTHAQFLNSDSKAIIDGRSSDSKPIAGGSSVASTEAQSYRSEKMSRRSSISALEEDGFLTLVDVCHQRGPSDVSSSSASQGGRRNPRSVASSATSQTSGASRASGLGAGAAAAGNCPGAGGRGSSSSSRWGGSSLGSDRTGTSSLRNSASTPHSAFRPSSRCSVASRSSFR
jgi:hypothetical protein